MQGAPARKGLQSSTDITVVPCVIVWEVDSDVWGRPSRRREKWCTAKEQSGRRVVSERKVSAFLVRFPFTPLFSLASHPPRTARAAPVRHGVGHAAIHPSSPPRPGRAGGGDPGVRGRDGRKVREEWGQGRLGRSLTLARPGGGARLPPHASRLEQEGVSKPTHEELAAGRAPKPPPPQSGSRSRRRCRPEKEALGFFLSRLLSARPLPIFFTCLSHSLHRTLFTAFATSRAGGAGEKGQVRDS